MPRQLNKYVKHQKPLPPAKGQCQPVSYSSGVSAESTFPPQAAAPTTQNSFKTQPAATLQYFTICKIYYLYTYDTTDIRKET